MIIYEHNKQSMKQASGYQTPRPSFRPNLPRIRLPKNIGKITIFGFVGVVLAAGIFAGVSYWKLQAAQKATESGQASNKELVNFKEVFLNAADEQKANGIVASMMTPRSWPTQRDQFGKSDLINPGDHGILNVVFLGRGEEPNNKGRIIIENVSAWMSADEVAQSAFGGLGKQAEKQKLFETLVNLRQTKSVETLNWAQMFKSPDQVGGIQKPTYVNTADGKLGGIVYATVLSNTNAYDPHVVAYLAGSVAGEPVLLRAQFAIENQTRRELYGSISPDLETVQIAINDFKAGKLEREDSLMIDHVRDVLKSITLDTASRQN